MIVCGALDEEPAFSDYSLLTAQAFCHVQDPKPTTYQ
jgi:hypothetical protein